MGVYNITTVTRPLRGVRLLIVAGMYLGLALVLILPPSLWYHQFTVPHGAYLLVTLGAALLGCLLIELNLKLHNTWLKTHHREVIEAGQGL